MTLSTDLLTGALTARERVGRISPMRARWHSLLLTGLTTGALALRAAAGPEAPLGISEESGGTRVRVWAPNAQSVELIGDFNNWRAMGTEKLTREGQGIWTTVLKRSLPKGAYRFRINGLFERRDPYGRAVSADEKASLFYSSTAFDWTGDQPPKWALDDLVIYELHVGTFNDPDPRDRRPGTFADVARRLDHLQDLGINVIQFLPIHEFAGEQSWGYNPSDPFAVEQSYGGPDGLKAFVKEAHRRGFAVHLDIVHNHYGPQNLDLLRFDGPGAPEYGGIYFYEDSEINYTPWGPRPRFDEPMVRRLVRDNAMMWIEEYHVDGFRWDSTVNIRSFGEGRRPIPAGLRMLEDINREIRTRFPHVHSIAEDSIDLGGFHASWEYDFHHSIMPELKAARDQDRRVRVIGGALSTRYGMPRVVYLDNHDEAGKLNGQTRFASDVDPANPGSEKARKLAGLGAVLTLTAPGIPLLFMGNEFLESGPFHEDRPLDWSKRQRFAPLVALHRDLIRLRRNLDGAGPALKGSGIDLPVMDEQRKVLVYWRWHEQSPNDRMVVVLNLSGQPLNGVTIPFPSEGPWQTRFNTDWTKYGGSSREEAAPFNFRGITPRASLTLPPYSARIFALAAGAAPQQVTQEHVKREFEPAPSGGGFSMYASIHLMGVDGAGQRFRWPLKRDGVQWEGIVRFEGVSAGTLRLSANDNGVIYWGQSYTALDRLPFQTTAERLGADLKIATRLDGSYRVRFNEETLEWIIEPIAAPPPPARPSAPSPPAPVLRTWTDVRGRTLEARLVEVQGEKIVLERAAGPRVEIRLDALSETDRAFVREQAERLSP